MKIKNSVSVILLAILAIPVIAFTIELETSGTVYTPNGSSVDVIRYNFIMSKSEADATRERIEKTYPKAVILGSATYEYNCHHYAWHMSTGNTEKWWMSHYTSSYPKTPTNIKYITDGSYVRVNGNDSGATHIVYFENGIPIHSAVKSSIPNNTVVSKWGAECLVRHSITDCPYNASDIRYYKLNMWISGPSFVEGDMETPIHYTLHNAPSGAEITWTVYPENCLLSGQGTTTITVKPSPMLHVSVTTSISGCNVNIPEVTTTCSQNFQIKDILLFRYGQTDFDFTLKAVCDLDSDTEITCVWSCDDPEVEFFDVQYPEDVMFCDGIGRFTAVRFPRDGVYNISVYGMGNNPSIGSSRIFTKEISVHHNMQSIDPPLETE